MRRAPGGTVVMFTPFPPERAGNIDPAAVLFRRSARRRELLVRPRRHQAALELVESGVVTAAKLGATLVSLDEVPRAYRDLAQARIIKPIVVFE